VIVDVTTHSVSEVGRKGRKEGGQERERRREGLGEDDRQGWGKRRGGVRGEREEERMGRKRRWTWERSPERQII